MAQPPQANLQRLGTFLKAKREEIGAELQDVETATSIKQLYLQAIEEGRIDQLISGAYARGFIKQYANFLGIDGERVLRDSKASFSQSSADFHYGIGSVERRREARSSSRLFNRAAIAGLVITLGIILWQFTKHFANP